MQLTMLAHMKKEFTAEGDLFSRFEKLEQQLKGGELTPIEVNMQMRGLQQELMARRMQKLQKQLQEQQGGKQDKGKGEEEEAPMREVHDEDL